MTTVAWKMLDGFNANKTFYTDMNGLEMAKRIQSRFENETELETTESEEPKPSGQKEGPVFIPVSSALAMRDTQSLR